MRFIEHVVRIGVDKAEGYDAERLQRDCPVVNGAYVITGERMVLQASDLESPEAIAKVNKRLAADLGTLQRDSADSESVKGTPVDLIYVANNGGLALNYGEAIKDRYRVRKGRIDQHAINQAMAWAVARNRLDLLTAGDVNALVAAWRGQDD
jgi:hypothetical protein